MRVKSFALVLCFTVSSVYLAVQRGKRALYVAASHGEISKVEQLLRFWGKFESRSDFRWTPIMSAALNAHVEIVEVLLTRGGSPNAISDSGITALICASTFDGSLIIQEETGHSKIINSCKSKCWAQKLAMVRLPYMSCKVSHFRAI